ncbi:MAG: aminotransferase class III-fold pyridoxal phosphate-dependent enzyme [Gemmatimonadota bacterium]|nr:MAG: aminotransferase class III-fold pyridoxal phosphate-dependent enzyme [Gemmatimonadota bacterium]
MIAINTTDPWTGSTSYAAFCRPKLADLLESLGLNVGFCRARGVYLYRSDEEGQEVEVLDLVGGFGASLLGHNNSELKELLKSQLDADVPFLAQCSERREAGLLAARINELLPTDSTYLCHFTNSGAEAVEAALKHAYKVRFDHIRRLFDRISRDIEQFFHATERDYPDIEIPGGDRDLSKFRDDLDEHNLAQFERFQQRPVVLALKGSFHGKTTAALKVTFNKTYREGFEGLSAIRPQFIDFADVERIVEIQRDHQIEFLVPRVADGRIVVEPLPASTIIALCLEVIQGEGGIRPVPDDVLATLAAQHADLGIPYLVDEIQTGCGRTGSFVAYGDGPLGSIDPEYLTLSKALGGGLVKIGAALIRNDIYDQNFGILHTSTFAEDELGCSVANRVLDILTRDDNRLMRSVVEKGEYLLAGLKRLQQQFPDVIRDVRGRGLMIGVEFDDLNDKSPLFRFGVRQGFLSLLVASYLLHYHRIRVLAPLTTLLKGNPGKKRLSILRIQPAADITEQEMDRVLAALGEVFAVIARNNEGVLVGHLVGLPASAAERSNPARAPVIRPRRDRQADFDARVGFLMHPARIDQVTEFYFPTLEGRVEPTRLTAWWSRLARFLEPDVVHTDYIGSEGFVVEANFVSVPYLPSYLIEVYGKARAANPGRLDLLRLEEAQDKIQDAVTTARELGDDHIPTSMVGLGAFTSIVTDRGVTVNDHEVPVTSGNAYTAGLMIEGIVEAAALNRIALPQATAAVVGAAGNIGSVLAVILSGQVGRLKLIGRNSADGIERLKRTRRECLLYLARKARAEMSGILPLNRVSIGGVGNRILRDIVLPALRSSDASSAWKRVENWLLGGEGDMPELASLLEEALDRDGGIEGNEYITVHTSVGSIRDCEIVTVATNSPESHLVSPELVKAGAIVSCASVPSNLSRAFRDRLDEFFVFDGGYARLPEGHEIDCVGLPTGGQAHGCLSETLLLGFDGCNSSFARGPITPEQVEEMLELAALHGFQLGDLRLNDSSHPVRRRTGVDQGNQGRAA